MQGVLSPTRQSSRDRSTRVHPAAVVVRVCLVSSLLFAASCDRSPTTSTSTYISVNGSIENAAGVSTIVTFHGFLDGRPMTTIPVTGAPRSRAAIIGGIIPGELGSHMLEVRMLDQVGSPNEYRICDLTVKFYDQATFNSARLAGAATLPEMTQSLTTGQGIVYHFSL